MFLLTQILSQANQSQSQQHAPPSSASSSQIPPPPSLPPPPGLSPAQFILHSSLPLVGCTKTPPSHLHPSIGSGCAQTPPPIMPVGLSGMTGSSGDSGWDNESKDPDKVMLPLMNAWEKIGGYQTAAAFFPSVYDWCSYNLTWKSELRSKLCVFS